MTTLSAQRELPGQADGIGRAVYRQLAPSHALRQRMLRAVARQTADRDADYPYLKDSRFTSSTDPVDYLFALPTDEHAPAEVFPHMRWGGRFIYAALDRRDVEATAANYTRQTGFVVERQPTHARLRTLGMTLPGLSRKVHYFIARKVHLIEPGSSTERFTFHVRLSRRYAPVDDSRGYVVVKKVPTHENIYRRLRERYPDLDRHVLMQRARKLVDRIFPVFLTREAAFLKILQRHLPEHLRHRVPKLLHMQRDERGMVRKIVMNWLRVGGEPLSQLEFAKQAAELLQAVHETVRVIHLDLRLDNVVITPDGVGFVDWGSAVRVGEDVSKNKLLESLFDEMMSTSQIQRLLGRMKSSGHVTNKYLCNAHQKIDKAADLFYLAMQISKPHCNPELTAFIEYDAASQEAAALKDITDRVLRPSNPEAPEFTSVNDLVKALDQLNHRG